LLETSIIFASTVTVGIGPCLVNYSDDILRLKMGMAPDYAHR